eukprot:scaffold62564_cov35-Tisochrysis_lutea.AAC.2
MLDSATHRLKSNSSASDALHALHALPLSDTYSALRVPPSPASLPLYLVLPKEKGTYLYFIMCLICRFIVRKKSAKKYINKIGQKTGILKLESQERGQGVWGSATRFNATDHDSPHQATPHDS